MEEFMLSTIGLLLNLLVLVVSYLTTIMSDSRLFKLGYYAVGVLMILEVTSHTIIFSILAFLISYLLLFILSLKSM